MIACVIKRILIKIRYIKKIVLTICPPFEKGHPLSQRDFLIIFLNFVK